MALATGTLFQVQASATTGNINGAGFNTANANFPTDATATSATGNSPVISSATYTFVDPGDVGNWIYIKAGTNWTPGFYQITSISGGAATVNATIGAAVQLNSSTGMYAANTVAGVATTASPTGGTFGVDYSQNDTANSTITNLASAGGITTVTSVSNPWTPVSVGNFLHITTTGTGAHFAVGWYEIVSQTLVSSVVLDRVPDDGSAGVAGTAQTGGAGRFNALEDAFGEMLPAGAMVFIKNGSYTFSGAFNVASSAATTTNPIYFIGFNALRGDTCTGTNRPIFSMGSNSFSPANNCVFRNLIMNGTATTVMVGGSAQKTINCKFTNTSITAGRFALSGQSAFYLFSCEFISQNGAAINVGTQATTRVLGCYIHDSATGMTGSTGTMAVAASIFEACDTACITTAQIIGSPIQNNTFYGREAKTTAAISATGATSTGSFIYNNIFYGFTTALSFSNLQPLDSMSISNFYNNTTNATNYYLSSGTLFLDPVFSGATQITGSTATTSGSTLTQSGGDFSTVTNNVDYLHVLSGTGVTTGIYLITGHAATTLTTNNALGTSSGGDVVYYVTTGHNFEITASGLKGTGTPSMAFTGNEGRNYIDVGAMQTVAATSTATSSTYAG